MILLSNHLLTLDEFKNVDNVVVRINMAHVKDKKELKQFLNRDYDVFLDYPKGRTNPPVPTLSFTEAIFNNAIAKSPATDLISPTFLSSKVMGVPGKIAGPTILHGISLFLIKPRYFVRAVNSCPI